MNCYIKDQLDIITEMNKSGMGSFRSKEFDLQFPESEGYNIQYTEDTTDIEEFALLSIYKDNEYTGFFVIWHGENPLFLYGTESTRPYDINCRYYICHIF